MWDLYMQLDPPKIFWAFSAIIAWFVAWRVTAYNKQQWEKMGEALDQEAKLRALKGEDPKIDRLVVMCDVIDKLSPEELNHLQIRINIKRRTA